MLYSQSLDREAKRRKISSTEQDGSILASAEMSGSKNVENRTNDDLSSGLRRTVKAIMDFDMHSDSIAIVTTGIKALIKIYGNPCHPERGSLASWDVITTIVLAMEKWRENEKVQEYGLALMQSVLHDLHEETLVENPLGECISTILMAMDNHQNAVKVNRYACAALSNIFSGCDRTLVDCAARFVKPRSGLDMVLKATKKFPDAELQTAALGLLHNLFTFPFCNIPIRVSGAITAVAKALDNNLDDQEIQELGRDVMKCFFP